MNDLELHEYFENMVRTLRSKGVLCAITLGLACVHYGIAESTQDCDLLCHTSSFPVLLDYLSETAIDGQPCQYRGNISPPLDARWHNGGWASHFEWDLRDGKVRLDVFGSALRESKPWTAKIFGFYASPNTVAEMKRTNRDKDWPFISSLAVRMIEAGDDDGWLHVFESDQMLRLMKQHDCPDHVIKKWPSLQLAAEKDPKLRGVLLAERLLWEELDRCRIEILERALRPYVSAVRKARASSLLELDADHRIRVACAESILPENPLKDHGIKRYIDECKNSLIDGKSIHPDTVECLPDVSAYFEWLNK
jgi:hypothetical protein